jgi:hypothetical protein
MTSNAKSEIETKNHNIVAKLVGHKSSVQNLVFDFRSVPWSSDIFMFLPREAISEFYDVAMVIESNSVLSSAPTAIPCEFLGCFIGVR